MPVPPTTLIRSCDAAPDEWRLSHTDVTSPYRCPLCDRSAEAAAEGLAGMAFGICPEILPQPICEACWRELPYLLSSTAEGTLNSRRPLLRLAELRGISDERILVIAYVEDALAHMRGRRAFDEEHARRRYLGRRPTRRIAKKRWKAEVAALEGVLAGLYEATGQNVTILADVATDQS